MTRKRCVCVWKQAAASTRFRTRSVHRCKSGTRRAGGEAGGATARWRATLQLLYSSFIFFQRKAHYLIGRVRHDGR